MRQQALYTTKLFSPMHNKKQHAVLCCAVLYCAVKHISSIHSCQVLSTVKYYNFYLFLIISFTIFCKTIVETIYSIYYICYYLSIIAMMSYCKSSMNIVYTYYFSYILYFLLLKKVIAQRQSLKEFTS